MDLKPIRTGAEHAEVLADIMNRTRPLSVALIRRLCADLRLPADVPMQPYALRDSSAA